MAASRTALRIALVVAALGSGCAVMSGLGHEVVHTELIVPATPAEIWAVLTDAEGYAAWNPILVRAEGEYVVGTQMRYRMRTASGDESDVTSKVIRCEPNQVLNQFGGVRGILTFDHTWQLEPVGDGTRVTQHEEYRGIGVWFWDSSWVGPTYDRANEALRDRVLELRTRSSTTATSPPPT